MSITWDFPGSKNRLLKRRYRVNQPMNWVIGLPHDTAEDDDCLGIEAATITSVPKTSMPGGGKISQCKCLYSLPDARVTGTTRFGDKNEMGVGRIMYHPIGKRASPHLICRECGRIIDLDESIMAPLKENLLRDYQFTAELRHLGILGLCATCKQKSPIKPENG